MKEEPLYHLLMPKEFKVWCRPNHSVGDFNVTILPSKATCANCLTAYRTATTGRLTRFKVKHTGDGRRCNPRPQTPALDP